MASAAAKRYAEAVFELAKERGIFDAWEADLTLLAEAVSDPTVAAFFANPSIPVARKQEILDGVLASTQPEARNLAHILIQHRHLDLAPQIAQAYVDAVLAERGIAIAEVTTAEPLGPREQEVVRAQLARLIGKDIQLRLRTDPSIIGGIVARVGDHLIDGSVVNQLRRLRARLAAAG